ncbi:putative uncharacterized protein DDB_G0290521 [Eurytemora carolleeae]|uniref:putative uncharacterized protein DDB_G0290521 n=1 Tax=Eurytemora carolleeae TaxID=1294199 RepID=UPI000C7764EC|nr:putative uncharacterized protein DDB_G0290521 [Eurytemora carolleeae]|eukprot:XP_023325318.1 putative uncharacterized protein DDB_G0290521 [Eurytemora affinis]
MRIKLIFLYLGTAYSEISIFKDTNQLGRLEGEKNNEDSLFSREHIREVIWYMTRKVNKLKDKNRLALPSLGDYPSYPPPTPLWDILTHRRQFEPYFGVKNPVTWSPVISTSSSYYPSSSSTLSTPPTYYPSTSSSPPTHYPSTSSPPSTYFPSTSSTPPTYYPTPPPTTPPTPQSTRPTSHPTTSRPVNYVPPPCTSLPLYCSYVEPFLPLPIECIDICDVDFTVLPAHCSRQQIEERVKEGEEEEDEEGEEEEEEEEEEKRKKSKKEEYISLRDFSLDCIEMIKEHHFKKTINLK